ncbi:hypothetical protein G6F37_009975 [Rhizopus arrhizus]|nr:hypothetical protein G6F38_005959 [Rhizopus arrhizus]KAG1153859.1 hypothetical protein G6F37_009975 [Rhizopus arrhizus]
MFLDIYKLSRYYETFIDEGFDRILCLLDITESDLISLNVKRGHRRLLQRAIATARGIPISTPIIINYGYHEIDRPYSPNDCNIIPLHNHQADFRRYYLRKKLTTTKPITPFDKFVNEIQLDSDCNEDILGLAHECWNQLTAVEKEKYERQALIANSDCIN